MMNDLFRSQLHSRDVYQCVSVRFSSCYHHCRICVSVVLRSVELGLYLLDIIVLCADEIGRAAWHSLCGFHIDLREMSRDQPTTLLV